MTKNNDFTKNQLFVLTMHFNGTLHFIYLYSCLKKDIIKGASATMVKPSAAGTEYTQFPASFTPNKMPRKSLK